MSVTHLIIDPESLRAVSESIKTYLNGSQTNLEDAMRALQTAEGSWNDEDMKELQEALASFYQEVEDIASKGLALTERCDKKLAALDRLHSMKI